MSFSSGVKDELCRVNLRHSHCEKAQLCGIIYSAGTISFTRRGFSLSIVTEHKQTALLALGLFKKVFLIDCSFSEVLRQPKNTVAYQVRAEGIFMDTLNAAGLSLDGGIRLEKEVFFKIIEKDCCKATFMRGAFLGSGSITDPNSAYHTEFVMHSEELAEALLSVLMDKNIIPGISIKKNATVVYIKDLEKIIQFFGLAGASGTVLELENIRIMKSIRNDINRQTNFDNANIDKTINAAQEQLASIRKIAETMGLDKLSRGLREAAELRLENPEATLTELAEMAGNTTRSGMNHRLRRLNIIAQSLPELKGGNHDL